MRWHRHTVVAPLVVREVAHGGVECQQGLHGTPYCTETGEHICASEFEGHVARLLLLPESIQADLRREELLCEVWRLHRAITTSQRHDREK